MLPLALHLGMLYGPVPGGCPGPGRCTWVPPGPETHAAWAVRCSKQVFHPSGDTWSPCCLAFLGPVMWFSLWVSGVKSFLF